MKKDSEAHRLSRSSSSNHNFRTRVSSQTNSASSSLMNVPSRRSFFSLLFNRSHNKEPELRNFLSSEGSINQAAWVEMSKDSSLKTRLKLLEQLALVMQYRQLQVNTLEAIYHETKDLLLVDEGKDAEVRLLIAIADRQSEQIGLPLRDSFFCDIRQMGLSDLSLEWLVALTKNGEDISGYEYDIVDLILDWLSEVLDIRKLDHRLAIRVLQLAQQLVKMNTGFLREKALDEIVHKMSVRICYKVDHLTYECLLLLDAILKYGHVPDSKLIPLITTLCTVIPFNRLGLTAWGLMKDLLRSSCGYNTLRLLLQMITCAKNCPKPKVIVGAVTAVTLSLWGNQRIDTLRIHPSGVLPALASGMEADPIIMREVFISLKRLLSKYGKELQQLTWHCVMQLLNKAADLLNNMPFSDNRKNLYQQLHKLIKIIEELYREGEFSGSPEAVFDLIERCTFERPPESVVALIDYRIMCISPLTHRWLNILADLVQRYLRNECSIVREKAVSVIHYIFIKYHHMFEIEIISNLVIPILYKVYDEKDMTVQNQMINILFDVAKTMRLLVSGETDLFASIISIIRTFLDIEFHREECSENLEIVIGGVCQMLHERFAHLKFVHLDLIINSIFYDPLKIYYTNENVCKIGVEIRQQLIAALLSILYDTNTGHLIKYGEKRVTNPFIICAGKGSGGEFKWSEICEIITLVLEVELCFPIIRGILRRLCRLFEFKDFIFSAGEVRMKKMKDALLNLFEKRAVLLWENDVDVKVDASRKADDRRNDVELAIHLCPVLSRLINYLKDENICKILVECVGAGVQQPIVACSLAIQIVPDCMVPLARQLMNHLTKLQPTSAKLSISILELVSDSSYVREFYQFFQMQDFETIVDILAPCTNVHRFNTYIIAVAFRTLMRWYVLIPENYRLRMAEYIINRVDLHLLSHIIPLNDLVQLANLEGRSSVSSISTFGSQPDSPSLSSVLHTLPSNRNSNYYGTVEASQRESLAEEARQALLTFMQRCKSDSVDKTIHPADLTEMTEYRTEHWVINDTIISLSVYLDNKPWKESDSSESERNIQLNEEFTAEGRRRHQSAVQRPENVVKPLCPTTLDDSFTMKRQAPKRQIQTLAVWTQLTIRHIYGKHSWLMRGLIETLEDFNASAQLLNIEDSSELIMHLCRGGNAVKITSTDKAKISRSLRNLDRIFALEVHCVGIVYIAPGQTKESEILSNLYGSERYSSFIRMLGEPISLEIHPGGLVPEIHGNFTYRYTDALSQLIFHIATLMPRREDDPQCNQKKKFIGNDYVSIIYNDSGKSYELGTISGKFAYVALEVVPLDESHMQIVIHTRQEIASWLSITRAFLPDEQAANFLKCLILRSQLSVNVWRREDENGPPYIGLPVERMRAIRNFATMGTKQI